jgi:hypothetical protein
MSLFSGAAAILLLMEGVSSGVDVVIRAPGCLADRAPAAWR